MPIWLKGTKSHRVRSQDPVNRSVRGQGRTRRFRLPEALRSGIARYAQEITLPSGGERTRVRYRCIRQSRLRALVNARHGDAAFLAVLVRADRCGHRDGVCRRAQAGTHARPGDRPRTGTRSRGKPQSVTPGEYEKLCAGDDATGCERACDGGDARSCTSLGWLAERGSGRLAKDEARAATLFQRGCAGGDALGCTNLGVNHKSFHPSAPVIHRDSSPVRRNPPPPRGPLA